MKDIAGWVAIILAAGVAIGFAGTVLILVWAPSTASAASVQLLGTLGGAMVGALATFLGARAVDRDRPMRREDLELTQWVPPPPVPERPERPSH